MSGKPESIEPTAYGVAELRAYSDIPYATETLHFIEEAVPPEQRVVYPPIRAPQLEARQKLIDKLIAETGGNQIFELASGLSARGLTFTEADPGITYTELDLHEMVRTKQALLKRLLNGRPQPANLHIINGDALDPASFSEADAVFTPGPLAVINEGLLRYLNFAEKAQVAANIKKLLLSHGGYWITSDITLAAGLRQEAQQAPGQNEAIDAMLGQTISNNSFESLDAASGFFGEQGYSVEVHPFSEVLSELASPKRLGLSEQETLETLKHSAVFVMRLTA